MDHLKRVTVSYLRELARKHLGPGHRKKNKQQLIAALAAYVPVLARLVRSAGGSLLPRLEAARDAIRRKARRKSQKRTDASSQSAGAGETQDLDSTAEQDSGSTGGVEKARTQTDTARGVATTKPAHVVNFPPRLRGHPTASGATRGQESLSATEEVAAQVAAVEPPQHPAEPLVEGFFVARVAGEREARRHHLLEEQARWLPPADQSSEYDEHLGELPLDYEDDTALLMPRDPHTLFVFWDFSAATRARALEGLDAPRAVLKVFEGEQLVREVEFALESRSFYIHGLPPGRPYRVEAHFIAKDGSGRRIGGSTNRVVLPPSGPSSDTSVRFLRMPTGFEAARSDMAETAATAHTRTAEFEEREYIRWRRVQLPGSSGALDIPELERERIARAVPPQSSGPGVPTESMPRGPGASDQRYLSGVARPPGASDQRYARSEKETPEPTPSGRGRT
ncbi:DUF4912 domain-containing protein [Corallococcus sp. M34]|uniref:DUF4912 domain-containing protein n=1 Tax=Citreicoccus inhibens TaxID=2849499 RepID=UPI001C2196CC|nr:DUF4912 domain-containing protein [Citreicoccus inhibens]MBU8900465.1 DUF4912 domain-containing protein [Citreicoccus inhibens]